jgi:hypothetical protein
MSVSTSAVTQDDSPRYATLGELEAATVAWALTLVMVADGSRRSAALSVRCGCGHLMFVHSEHPEGHQAVGTCLYNGCSCVNDTGARLGW